MTLENKIRLVAEWEPQSATQLTWPHDGADWADHLEPACAGFAQIGATISQDQRVLNVCRDPAHQRQVVEWLQAAHADPDKLDYVLADSDDIWARDHGLINTFDRGQLLLHDFQFDGWGGKYPAAKDNAINRRLEQSGIFHHTPIQHHAWVLEGGAVETDGQGTLLATCSSVLDPQRNPDLNPGEMEQLLQETLGVRRFLWLAHGALSGDDTDSHIDMLVRFTDPQTLLYHMAPDGDDDHAVLAAMRDELKCFRTAAGRPYQLIALPFPGIHRDSAGRRLPASYANYVLTNHLVLLPGYGVMQDEQAREILMHCFPTRQVILIDCRLFIQQNGGLHCLTMPIHAQPVHN